MLDTDSGRLVRKLRMERSWGGPVLHDGIRDRVYVMVVPGNDVKVKGPRTPSVVAYDLRSGREAGRVRLDGVLAGSWPTERKVRDFPIMAMLEPGLALSPDGRRIAIAHADREAITLVDTERMEIASTRTLARPRRLLERLGLRQRVARAKAMEGVSLQAEFSSDGRTLYVTGQRLEMDAADKVVSTGLGLRAVAVESGQVRAEALDEARLLWVKQPPEGGPVYALKEEMGDDSDGTYRTKLLRLDSDTLEVGAERELAEYRDMFFLQAP